MVFKIAVRNLVQQKTKTVIVGGLVAFSVMVAVVGNSLISNVGASIAESFRNTYTGEVMVTSDEMSIGVFGAQTNDVSGPPLVPLLKDYDRVVTAIRLLPEMVSYTSQMSTYVGFNFAERGVNWGLLFGIDADDYWSSMDNIHILSGRRLVSDESGVLLNSLFVKKIHDENGVSLEAGQTVQLNSYQNGGMHIREVPVVGIFEFKAANKRLFGSPCFVDIGTLRALTRSSITKEVVSLDPSTLSVLNESGDDFFSETVAKPMVESPSSGTNLDSLRLTLMDRRQSEVWKADRSWDFLLVRLKAGTDADLVTERLNQGFLRDEISATAQGWQASGAPDSYLFWFIGLIFNGFLVVLGFVSVLIIMNTLVISVMERTGEIGTMRALGAPKGVVRRLFVAETLLIAVVFGLVGMLLGTLVVGLLGWVGIPTDNDFLSIVYGGKTLRPTLAPAALLWATGLILLIGTTSWVYPVNLALKVSPLKAITTE